MTELDPTEPLVVVATRIAALPEPHVPSVRGACSSCSAPVWLSRASEADLLERPGSSVVCAVCAIALFVEAEGRGEPVELGLSERTRDEVRRYRGR